MSNDDHDDDDDDDDEHNNAYFLLCHSFLVESFKFILNTLWSASFFVIFDSI